MEDLLNRSSKVVKMKLTVIKWGLNKRSGGVVCRTSTKYERESSESATLVITR